MSWISVKDGLPDVGQTVLCLFTDDEAITARVVGDTTGRCWINGIPASREFHSSLLISCDDYHDSRFTDVEITHWRPWPLD